MWHISPLDHAVHDAFERSLAVLTQHPRLTPEWIHARDYIKANLGETSTIGLWYRIRQNIHEGTPEDTIAVIVRVLVDLGMEDMYTCLYPGLTSCERRPLRCLLRLVIADKTVAVDHAAAVAEAASKWIPDVYSDVFWESGGTGPTWAELLAVVPRSSLRNVCVNLLVSMMASPVGAPVFRDGCAMLGDLLGLGAVRIDDSLPVLGNELRFAVSTKCGCSCPGPDAAHVNDSSFRRILHVRTILVRYMQCRCKTSPEDITLVQTRDAITSLLDSLDTAIAREARRRAFLRCVVQLVITTKDLRPRILSFLLRSTLLHADPLSCPRQKRPCRRA
jgi:hypothetical protein